MSYRKNSDPNLDMVERKCKICGQAFIPTYEYVFRIGEKFYCSWSCIQVAHAKEESKGKRHYTALTGTRKSNTATR